MVSHWLGGRLWGLAIGFPIGSFAQESMQSYFWTACSFAQTTQLLSSGKLLYLIIIAL
jgi:hypothetical protein